jgi:hypothetical protein
MDELFEIVIHITVKLEAAGRSGYYPAIGEFRL